MVFLFLISLIESFQDLLDTIKSQFDVISFFIQSFEGGHNCQQVVDFSVDILVAGVDVFLGSIEESADFCELAVDVVGHEWSIELVGDFGVAFADEGRNKGISSNG